MRTFIFASVYEIFDKSSVWVRIWLLDGFFSCFCGLVIEKSETGERNWDRESVDDMRLVQEVQLTVGQGN